MTISINVIINNFNYSNLIRKDAINQYIYNDAHSFKTSNKESDF